MMIAKYVVQTMKLILTIMLIVIFCGLFWYVYCDLTTHLLPEDTYSEDLFLENFEGFKTFTAL
mgnify:CR=1 FL=1